MRWKKVNNMKNNFLAVILGLIVFIVMTISSLGMSKYHFHNGITALNSVKDADKVANFSINSGKAVAHFEYALAFDMFGLNGKDFAVKTSKYLGESYLFLGENIKAKNSFEKALAILAPDEVIHEIDDLKFWLIKSTIRVNGIVDDGWRAIVNQNIVSVGDEIGQVKIVEVTSEYVGFTYQGKYFTDSVDKYNSLVMRGLADSKQFLRKASKAEDIGIAAASAISAVKIAKEVIEDYAVDKPQLIALNAIVEKGEDLESRIRQRISKAKRNRELLVGMNGADIIEVFGEPKNVNSLYNMDANERWEYVDRELFFRVEGMDKHLVRWKDKY